MKIQSVPMNSDIRHVYTTRRLIYAEKDTQVDQNQGFLIGTIPKESR